MKNWSCGFVINFRPISSINFGCEPATTFSQQSAVAIFGIFCKTVHHSASSKIFKKIPVFHSILTRVCHGCLIMWCQSVFIYFRSWRKDHNQSNYSLVACNAKMVIFRHDRSEGGLKKSNFYVI